MYTLREVKKDNRKSVCNTSLGNQYHLVSAGSEGYDYIRNNHFLSMGFTQEETDQMQNPFIIHTDGTKEIYLYDGREYYIMTESGKTFENLSGYVQDLKPEANEAKLDNSFAAIPAEDVLQRPTNYSLYQIFDRLRAGRKAPDQHLLKDLMDALDSGEPFDIVPSKDLEDYNTIVTEVLLKHMGTFKDADVRMQFKENQLRNRGYSPAHTL